MTERNNYADLKTATPKNTGLFETAKTEDFNPDIEEHRIEFQKNPQGYFEIYGEESVELIPQFLNKELIEKNPNNFVMLYEQLLREISFRENIKLQFKTLLEVIGCKESVSNEVPEFLLKTKLLDKTYDTFAILKMEEECKIINSIMQDI